MVTVQHTKLGERILTGIEKAKVLGEPVLVSEVQKMNQVDPLSFFVKGRKNFGERFFWQDSSGQTLMIGVGVCKKVESDRAAERFTHIEEQWNRLVSEALIHNPFAENGIGLMMFGGFSFDPLKRKTALWSRYADSLFHIPLFMYSEIKGQAYLTINVLCTEDDDYSLVHEVEENKRYMLSESVEKGQYIRQNRLMLEKEVSPEKWMETVESIIEELKVGSLKKVVLARELRLAFHDPIQIEQVLSTLLKQQKKCFVFAFESKGDCYIGATPERLVKKQDEHLLTMCLASSIRRGKTKEEDEELGNILLADEKSLIEHRYVVDMIEEAVAELCEGITLPDQPQLMKMRDIQHLYTPVVGTAKKSTSLLLLVDRLHPTPALGGLPKKASVEKIREVEELDRGFYGAPLGWIDYKGNGDFAVSIRSGLVQGNEASLFAGCGVVEDSNVLSEYEETKVKFRPMLSALGGLKK